VLDWLDLPALRPYRLHSKEAAAAKNLATRGHVARRVLLQNAIQIATGVAMALLDPEFCDSKPYRGLGRSALEFISAMLVMDAWQYFIHRAMHESKVLYNAIHSHHHRLLVCYAYGALYNHPLEAFLLDTVGGVVTYYASGISCKASVAFFTFATVKTVLDHSGYRYPVNLLHNCFPNNAAYHDAHHDLRGFRKNYSQVRQGVCGVWVEGWGGQRLTAASAGRHGGPGLASLLHHHKVFWVLSGGWLATLCLCSASVSLMDDGLGVQVSVQCCLRQCHVSYRFVLLEPAASTAHHLHPASRSQFVTVAPCVTPSSTASVLIIALRFVLNDVRCVRLVCSPSSATGTSCWAPTWTLRI
jgi:sphinganine C4-monooxygenase